VSNGSSDVGPQYRLTGIDRRLGAPADQEFEIGAGTFRCPVPEEGIAFFARFRVAERFTGGNRDRGDDDLHRVRLPEDLLFHGRHPASGGGKGEAAQEKTREQGKQRPDLTGPLPGKEGTYLPLHRGKQ